MCKFLNTPTNLPIRWSLCKQTICYSGAFFFIKFYIDSLRIKKPEYISNTVKCRIASLWEHEIQDPIKFYHLVYERHPSVGLSKCRFFFCGQNLRYDNLHIKMFKKTQKVCIKILLKKHTNT